MEEKIKRINELYHKSQAEGLSSEEREEQQRLRREYVESVRANLRGQLDGITIERPDGTRENLGEKHRKKTESGRAQESADKTADKTAGKIAVRKAALEARERLSEEERKKGSALLAERILGHQWFCGAEDILCFVSRGAEIDTREIMEEALRRGKRLYVPKVLSDGDGAAAGRMEFYRIRSLSELTKGYRGILEPSGSLERYVCSPERAAHTLMLMPGAAFDVCRNRLGYGGGFYDRYLADRKELRQRTVAVGYRCQLVEEIPAEDTDIRPCQVICV